MIDRAELERKQCLQALCELGAATSKVADAALAHNFTLAHDRLGQVFGLLDRAMARLARLGTDRSFENIGGENPHEEACKALSFYGQLWRKTIMHDGHGDVETYELPNDLLQDRGKMARAWLLKHAVPIHTNESASTMAKAATPVEVLETLAQLSPGHNTLNA